MRTAVPLRPGSRESVQDSHSFFIQSIPALLLVFVTTSALAQADFRVSGAITTKDGRPIAGVLVYGSLGKCCPSQREQFTTGEDGAFRLEHPGVVIHLSKEGFEPRSLVLKAPVEPQQIVLQPASEVLRAPLCTPLTRGEKQIHWMKYGVHFKVHKRDVQITGGKPDVDYVVIGIKPKGSDAEMQFWFGPYAIGTLPDDGEFIQSTEFSQRYIVNEKGGSIGLDTRGRLADGRLWRHTAAIAQGGAVYRNASAQDAQTFDRIIDSICEVPYPSQ
jgi:hypothetical protein